MVTCKTCGKELRVESDGSVRARIPCCKERNARCAKNKRSDPCGAIVQVYVEAYDGSAMTLAWCSKHCNRDVMDIPEYVPPPPDDPSNYEDDPSSESVSGMKLEERIFTVTKKEATARLSKDTHTVHCLECNHEHPCKSMKLERVHPSSDPKAAPGGRAHWRAHCPQCGSPRHRFL